MSDDCQTRYYKHLASQSQSREALTVGRENADASWDSSSCSKTLQGSEDDELNFRCREAVDYITSTLAYLILWRSLHKDSLLSVQRESHDMPMMNTFFLPYLSAMTPANNKNPPKVRV